MPELRRDPFTRGWVMIAPERGERPHQMPAGSRPVTGPPAPDPSCPFCPGHEEDTPGELWRLPDRDGGWTVRVVPNRYPVLTPGVHPASHHSDGPFIYADGIGSHEVVIESTRHDWDLPDGDDATVAAVLAAYRTRARALRAQHPGLVLPFRNHGAAAGTSLAHPHSQIVATPIVPLRQRQLFDVARAYYDDHGSCLYVDVRQAEVARGQRIVATSDHVVAFTPYASRVPYETWLVPCTHQASFADADEDVLAETAALLRRVLDALSSLLGDVPYNYAIVSAPTKEEGSEYFLWHLQLLPGSPPPPGSSWAAARPSLPSRPNAPPPISATPWRSGSSQPKADGDCRACCGKRRTGCGPSPAGRPGPTSSGSNGRSWRILVYQELHPHDGPAAVVGRAAGGRGVLTALRWRQARRPVVVP